jgi:hypothetical protein
MNLNLLRIENWPLSSKKKRVGNYLCKKKGVVNYISLLTLAYLIKVLNRIGLVVDKKIIIL